VWELSLLFFRIARVFFGMTITLAVDLMGGDKAPGMVLQGIEHFLLRGILDVNFLIFGLERCREMVEKSKILGTSGCYEFVAAEYAVDASEKPAAAVRSAKKSTMGQAILAVRDGKAQACVSAGNTGALMAMSKVFFKTIDGIDRPALCTIMPSVGRKTVFLDMGANIDCTAENLYQFAMMGSEFCRAIHHVEKPTIGLLNIGTESIKGNELIKNAHDLISQSTLASQFVGYVEGNEINLGEINVIVTDGFTGNVVLKAIEGASKFISQAIKDSFTSSLYSKIAGLIAKPVLKKSLTKIDPNNYNGALLLGLNGIAIKSHGSATAQGFSNALLTSEISFCDAAL
jgi:glycerol-3-phosphate acyltransferase PlsX